MAHVDPGGLVPLLTDGCTAQVSAQHPRGMRQPRQPQIARRNSASPCPLDSRNSKNNDAQGATSEQHTCTVHVRTKRARDGQDGAVGIHDALLVLHKVQLVPLETRLSEGLPRRAEAIPAHHTTIVNGMHPFTNNVCIATQRKAHDCTAVLHHTGTWA